MPALGNRVLVRLSDTAPLSEAAINEALGHGLTWQRYRSPGLEVTLAELEALERAGLARRQDNGWILTGEGARRQQLLEDRFDNSNGYGVYGF